VFLSQKVTEAQRRAILTRIQAVDAVDSVAYESQAEAFARFKEQFSDTPRTHHCAPGVLFVVQQRLVVSAWRPDRR
jgi:cell division protein FtsX